MGGPKDEAREGVSDAMKQLEWEKNANNLDNAWGHSEHKSGKGAAYDEAYKETVKDGRK